MRSSHASKSYQNELDQRNAGRSKEDADRQRMAALRGHAEFYAKLGTAMPNRQKKKLAQLSKQFS